MHPPRGGWRIGGEIDVDRAGWAFAVMPSGAERYSSTLRGIGSEVNTTSQPAATSATEVPAVAPRSVQALIAAS